MFSLQKTALITGAGSGIGAAIAEVFAEAGARVFVADRDEAAGHAVAAGLPRAEFLALDVTSEPQCEAAAAAVLAGAGRLDILVNNAGIVHVGTAATTTGADFDRVLGVNTRVQFT